MACMRWALTREVAAWTACRRAASATAGGRRGRGGHRLVGGHRRGLAGRGTVVHFQGGEHVVVEAVLALEKLVDPAQEGSDSAP